MHRARDEREARLLAALNHPHIAAIYGIEDAGSTRALVMELAEGPTLLERMSQGPIPVDEALDVARQMSEALEYAHERGIVHRDLKPANVKVTPEGEVKLLDFGPGEGPRRRRRAAQGRFLAVPDAVAPGHAGRRHPGHRVLHVAGAGVTARARFNANGVLSAQLSAISWRRDRQ